MSLFSQVIKIEVNKGLTKQLIKGNASYCLFPWQVFIRNEMTKLVTMVETKVLCI